MVQTSIGRHWREIDALLRERVECAHLCRVDWRGREELWHLTRYVPDRLATELAGLSRAGGEGGSQSVPNDSRLTSPEESFDKWSDAVLLDSARRIAQEFRKASADLVRLEADLARRQLASASEITARSRAGGHAATSAAAPSRIEVITARLVELTPEMDAIAVELGRRDIRPTTQPLPNASPPCQASWSYWLRRRRTSPRWRPQCSGNRCFRQLRQK